ncbi:MAG: hypothetical protein KAI47_24700, partial [Deltaproteobacteria bacterium]|nr:hypothetical protein [Deltaproteobacteria bacterium]
MEAMMERYRVIVAAAVPQNEEDEGGEGERVGTTFVARIPEITGCEVSAPTRVEALERVEKELAAQLQNMKDQGVDPPRPIDDQSLDGEIAVTVSRQLHRDLLFAAADAGVELQTYLVEVLSRALPWTMSRQSEAGVRRDDRGGNCGGNRGGNR